MKNTFILTLVVLLSFLIASIAIADPPGNDNCADAYDMGTLVAGSPAQHGGSLVDATQDCMFSNGAEVWAKFTVTSCMDVTIDFCDDPGMYWDAPGYLFTECPCSGMINYNERDNCTSNNNPSLTWMGLEAGTYYYPIWSDFGNESYVVNVTGVDCPPPPDNDNCSDAIAIGEVTDMTFTTRGATHDGGGSCISGANIWYVYAPSFTGTVRFNLDGSEYATMIAVYDGISCSPLPFEIACSEDSHLDIMVVTGQQYLVEIGGMFSETGNGSLTIGEAPPPPPNDDCENATDAGTLTAGESVQLTGTTTEATSDCEMVGNPEVWVKFTITECMDITLDYCGTYPPVGILSVHTQLFDSCPCGNGIAFNEIISCPDDNPGLSWYNLPAGTYYYPVIQGYELNGPYTINIVGTDCLPPPPNDDCQNATDAGTLTAGDPMELTGSSAGATNDCENVGGREVWIQFTISENMHVTVDLCGTVPAFDSYFDGLFDQCPCGEIIWAANSGRCEDYNPILYWYDLPSGTYLFPILSSSSLPDDYIVHVTGYEVLPPPEPTTIIAPDTVTGTTCDALNNCYRIPGEDVTYEVTIPSDGDWVFSLCNSSTVWDSYLYLDTELCGSEMGSNDDGCGEDQGHAELTVQGLSAGTYFLTVDSRSDTCGDYTLQIHPLPGPCDGSYYANGDADFSGVVGSYRGSSYWAYSADDFTLTEDVTINTIKFTGAANMFYPFNGYGDYQILDGSTGVPGEVIDEGTMVPCNRIGTDQFYEEYMVNIYQFENLAIELTAGAYFLACRPNADSDEYLSYWMTTGNQTGSTAYYQDYGNPAWTLAEINSDLAFCIFATTGGGDTYDYLPGDANMINGQWPPKIIGADVTYLVGYFRGINGQCLVGGFYNSGDANGDCTIIGSDVTRLVSYFRGLSDIAHCADYTPAWLVPDDCPTEAPIGWPNCEDEPEGE
jgi:hypothetical protein